MSTLKHRFLRAFAGSTLGAVTGASVAAICTVVVVLKAIVGKDPGIQNFGMLSWLVGLIAATCGAFWGALFGAILGFCDFGRPLNVLLGAACGGVLAWYLSDTFYGFPVVLRACFSSDDGCVLFRPSIYQSLRYKNWTVLEQGLNVNWGLVRMTVERSLPPTWS